MQIPSIDKKVSQLFNNKTNVYSWWSIIWKNYDILPIENFSLLSSIWTNKITLKASKTLNLKKILLLLTTLFVNECNDKF